jgi:hypothetical protein
MISHCKYNSFGDGIGSGPAYHYIIRDDTELLTGGYDLMRTIVVCGKNKAYSG